MHEDILKIIKDGTLAPSGENCQPWKFFVDGSKISIFNLPERDQSIYNFAQKGSYVSNGALIENMFISASKLGYVAKADIFPDERQPELVAVVTLEKAESKYDSLYESIPKRHTNRKDYNSKKLTSEQKSALILAAKESSFGEMKIIDDQPSLGILGKALAVNERVIFENKALHDFFYGHILWKEEEQQKAGGFYIKTLEFLPHQLKGVKLFKSWPLLNILNKIGKVSQVIAKENAEKYARSGALALFLVKGKSKKEYVNAGRMMERAWLKATELGISVQPCTGVLYFMENIWAGNDKVFSREHQEIIKRAYKDISESFGAEGFTTPMLFRLGFSEPSSARAMRMEAEVEFK